MWKVPEKFKAVEGNNLKYLAFCIEEVNNWLEAFKKGIKKWII